MLLIGYGVLFPLVLAALAMVVVRRFDDRGLFAVFPFPLLPLVSGLLFGVHMLQAGGLGQQLAPSVLWLSPYWGQPPAELIAHWLWPPRLLEQWALAQRALVTDAWTFSVSLQLILVALLVISAMSALAWRSLGALRGLLIHGVLSACSALAVVWVSVLLAWLLHRLNFWVLPLTFAVVYFWGSITPILLRARACRH
jgi:hypothetical protein